MNVAIPISLGALVAVGVIVIGSFYIVSPERISGSFGLKPPASDADTRAWLHLKGVRDVGAGLLVLTLIWIADRGSLGIALLVLAVIPIGAMSVILGSGGSKSKAFFVHGVTCAVMLVAGPLVDPCHSKGVPPFLPVARAIRTVAALNPDRREKMFVAKPTSR